MKLKIILPIAAVVLLLFGVVLMALTLASPNSSFIKEVTLNDDGVEQELEMSANGLIPGDSREYTLNLKGQSTGDYLLNFEFVELNDGALKNFVKVTLQCGDKSDTYNLSDLLGGQVATLKIKTIAKQTTVVKVIYSIPSEVGNEAQNATVDFTVNLSADKN